MPRASRTTPRASLVALLAVLAAALPADAGRPRTFTLLQINDAYELFPVEQQVGERLEKRGGLAHLATLVAAERRKGPTLFLHAGDFLSPSLLSIKLRHRGAQMVTALDALGLDVATFGNHEFDFGCATLVERVKQSRFAWTSANVRFPEEAKLPPDKVSRTFLRTLDGVRVGVFGLTITTSAPVECAPGARVAFDDPVASARRAVAELVARKADVIVALTHLRFGEDHALAQAVPEIDFIVGGHEHEVMDGTVGRTLITKAGANAATLGLVGARAVKAGGRWVVEKSWRPVPVDAASIPPDPALEAVLAPYAEQLVPFAAVLGKTEVELDGREEVVRERESGLGNWIADVIRHELQSDVALVNGGSIRGDRVVRPGPITLGTLYDVLPFENRMLAVPVTGAGLRAALENGVSLAGYRSGRFPQVSGLTFRFDPQRPAGQRVTEVRVGGQPLREDGRYTLGTLDFLVKRGAIDGYALPQEVVKDGGDLHEALKRALAVPLRSVPEGRIVAHASEPR